MPSRPPLPAKGRQASRVVSSPAGVFAPLDGGPLRTVSIDAVAPDPSQPRTHFDQDALQGLADSISERGLLQPPLVREAVDGIHIILAGERRWRASRLAGLTELPVLVRDGNLADQLVENLAREDLTPIEVARGLVSLTEDLKITQEAVGKMVGLSRPSVSNHIRLLDHPDVIIEFLNERKLTFDHGRELLRVNDHALRNRLAREAVRGGWTTRALKTAIDDALSPRPRRALSADAAAFTQRLGDAVSRASGLEVKVGAGAGERFTFTVTGQDNARALAERLGAEDLGEM
jgi:ParB family chromosome partitioning protein